MFNKPQAYLTKVFIQIFLRNKQYIIFSLILPLLILGIVGLNEGDTDPIDIGLVNNSKSNLSQEFIEQLTSSNLFNVEQESEAVYSSQRCRCDRQPWDRTSFIA